MTHIPARVGHRTAHAQRTKEEEKEEEGAGGGQRNNSLCALHCCSFLPAFAAPDGEEGMAADATLAEAQTPPADESSKLRFASNETSNGQSTLPENNLRELLRGALLVLNPLFEQIG